MRRKQLLALAAVAVLAGCGEDADGARVAWTGEPTVVRQPELPDDTIVSGTVRNESDRTLELDADDVRLLDADGDPVEQTTVRFSTGITHALYPGDGAPSEEPPEQRRRLGETATVEPDGKVPLVVSWRVSGADDPPVRVDLGAASLELP